MEEMIWAWSEVYWGTLKKHFFKKTAKKVAQVKPKALWEGQHHGWLTDEQRTPFSV